MSLKELLAQEEIENTGTVDGAIVWLKLPCGGEAHITHAGNPEFQAKLRKLRTVYRKQNSLRPDQPLPEEVDEKLNRDAMVGTVLKAIRGVELEPGVPFESTPANLRQMLESRKVRGAIVGRSVTDETWSSENLELVSGNSAALSAGD